MERFFQILAVILSGVTAFFLWQGNGDGAFVSAVLGAVAFFLSVRFQVKGRLKQREAEEEEKGREEEEEISDSELHLNELPPATTPSVNNEQRATSDEQRTTDKVL
jgi:hypothetical protein